MELLHHILHLETWMSKNLICNHQHHDDFWELSKFFITGLLQDNPFLRSQKWTYDQINNRYQNAHTHRKLLLVLNSSSTTWTLPAKPSPQNTSNISKVHRQKHVVSLPSFIKKKKKKGMQKSFSLLQNYIDLENSTAIFNFGPATGFKSQIPSKTYSLDVSILPSYTSHKNFLIRSYFLRLYLFTCLWMCWYYSGHRIYWKTMSIGGVL